MPAIIVASSRGCMTSSGGVSLSLCSSLFLDDIDDDDEEVLGKDGAMVEVDARCCWNDSPAHISRRDERS